MLRVKVLLLRLMMISLWSHIKSADKVYLEAKDHYLEGDEETAYVFYMRYFNLITLIKKSSKYKEKKVS